MSTIEFNESLVQLEHNLRSFAYGFTRNTEDAEDLTQETMLKAMTYRTQYVAQTNFKAWVFTIMRNIFINQYRRKVKASGIFERKQEQALADQMNQRYSAADLLVNNELNGKINALDQEYRFPFQLHVDGYKYHEIADSLKLPLGTVKSRIFMARKKLMEQLPDYA